VCLCVCVFVCVCVCMCGGRSAEDCEMKDGDGTEYREERCSVLQCVAACCSVLQRVTVCCRLLQCVAV